jgi:hypothetical protein
MKLCLIRARYVKLFSDMRRMSEKTRRHHWVPPRPLFNRLRQADRAVCLKKTKRHHWVPPRPLFNRLRQADRAACLKNKAAPLGAASPLFNRLRQADRAVCLKKNKAAPLGAASFKKAIKRSSAADYSSQPSINLMIAPISRTCSPSASLISSIPETFGRGS